MNVSAQVTYVASQVITIKGTASEICKKWEYSLDNGVTWTQYSTTSGTAASTTLSGIAQSNYNLKVRATRSSDSSTATSSTVKVDLTAPTVSLTVSSVTTNSFYLSVFSSAVADLWYYSLNNGSTWTQFSSATAQAVSKTITGLSPSTSYTLKVRARKKSNMQFGHSSSNTVTTYGHSKIVSISPVIIDEAEPYISLTWSVYNSSYTHTLTVKKGTTTLATVTDLTGSTGTNNKTINLTAAQRTAILEAIPSDKNFTASFSLNTFDGSTQIGSSSVTQIVSTTQNNSAPTFTAFTCADINGNTTALTDDDQLYIQSKSILQISCTAATARNESSIVKYQASIGEKSSESTTTALYFGTIPDSGELVLTVKAIDSRGYETAITKDITVIGYGPVSVESYSIRRENNVEDTVQLEFEGVLSPVTVEGTDKNDITQIRIRYKQVTASSWSDYEVLSDVTSDSSSFEYSNNNWKSLDESKAFNVQLEVSDRLSTQTVSMVINTGTPLVSFRNEKVGINTNNPQCALDVNGNIRMNGYGVMGYVTALADSGTDLNDITLMGIYFQDSDVNAVTNKHYPATKAGVLEVFTSAVSILQRYTLFDGSAVYIRSKIGNSWGSWT